ncbi:hypothetical protein [Thermophilibacter sp.]
MVRHEAADAKVFGCARALELLGGRGLLLDASLRLTKLAGAR